MQIKLAIIFFKHVFQRGHKIIPLANNDAKRVVGLFTKEVALSGIACSTRKPKLLASWLEA